MHDLAFPTSIRCEQREVTLLFADVRGFTELSASLEVIPLVCDLIGQVMDCLTEAVVRHEGCVVDYYGDGLLAMWNAPSDEPEHAELACWAGLEMLETMPAVAADWSGAIQANLRLGIGVHTGIAQVGNAGSSRQQKFGPRGPSVHLANRVEGSTKRLRLPLVVTSTTAERLSDRIAVHRVCRARMPGFGDPIDLFAIRRAAHDASLLSAWRRYDEALRLFEQGRLQEAGEVIESLEEQDDQIPWRFLAAQVERESGRRRCRRSTDEPVLHSGVIPLNAK